MNSQAASNLFRYFKTFLENSENCQAKRQSIPINPNFKQEIDYVEKKFQCRKFALISAHDDVLQSIIRNMFKYEKEIDELVNKSNHKKFTELEDKFKFYWPSYVADFSLELHKVNDTKYVKIKFNGKELNYLDLLSTRYSMRPTYGHDGIQLESFLFYLENRIDRQTKYDIPCAKP